MYSKNKYGLKRGIDLIFGIILLIILLPVFLIIALIIRIDSNGDVLFIQERTGLNGKPFKMYKFCSMESENKITGFGQIMCKYSIDELPQIINVIKGEMSFIGPRPWLPEYFANLDEQMKKRVNVLPGMTGYTQIKGRNSLSIVEKLNYDLWYVKNISFWLDIKIFVKTFFTIFQGKNFELSHEEILKEIAWLKNNKDL